MKTWEDKMKNKSYEHIWNRVNANPIRMMRDKELLITLCFNLEGMSEIIYQKFILKLKPVNDIMRKLSESAMFWD